MAHTHTAQSTRNINGNTLSKCSCGAQKWSNGYLPETCEFDTDGWFIAKPVVEENTNHAYEMLQTEGYGYGKDVIDPLDSHMPNIN